MLGFGTSQMRFPLLLSELSTAKASIAFVSIRASTLVSVTELGRSGIRRVDIATATTRHRVAGDHIGRQHI